MRLRSELKIEGLEVGKPSRSIFTPSFTLRSTPCSTNATPSLVVGSTDGSVAAGAEAAAAAAAAAEGEAGLLDHDAATICATPMLLQFLRDLVLSWRTKLGGKRKINEDRPPRNDAVPESELGRPVNRAWLGFLPAPPIFGAPEKSGSERHSKDGKTLAHVDTAILKGHGCASDSPETFGRSSYSSLPHVREIGKGCGSWLRDA